MRCEDPAVAAAAQKQRELYLTASAGVLGLGAMAFWGLGAINNKAKRDAQQWRRLQAYSDSPPL